MARTRRGRGDRGVAMIMTGLVLVPLMMFAAFGVDLASWYSRISYLQKSADAAALAGTVWMPDLTKATVEAKASLRSNGLVDKNDPGGSPNITVVVARGAKATSLRVTVTDGDATRYFSQVFAGTQSLTRSAEAEYNLPIPLGSPLNYFGGDSTRTGQPSVTTYSVSWPTDYTTRVPVNDPCNIGTSSSQNLGRWSGSGPSYSSSGFNSSDPQCRWGASGSATAGTSDVPPPDYTTRVPIDGVNGTGCKARRNGLATGTTFGRWRNSAWSTSTGGGAGPCTWTSYATDVASIPADATTRVPVNQPCRVGYETSGPGGGWWSGGIYSPTSAVSPVGPAGGRVTEGNTLCRWAPQIDSATFTPPNPIDPTRSPGFWAMIEGPGSVSTNGDAYNTRCYIPNGCGSDDNVQFKPSSDPDRGFWYVVKMPSAPLGSVDINVFDASYNPCVGSSCVGTLAGDRSLGGTAVFPTEFRVFTQTSPIDFSARTPYSGASSGNQTDGSCYWTLAGESTPASPVFNAAFSGMWRRLCTITAPTPGGTYLVNVQTTGPARNGSGSFFNGINGYALEAVANGGAGTQPALYAFSSMGMQNNNTCAGAGCTPPPATFYLAEIGQQYAGKTLVVELWDPGDATGNASIFPKRPSGLAPGPVTDVPASECEFTASPSPSNPQASSAGGPTGSVYPTPQQSDFLARCGIRTTVSGARRFNGEWLAIRIAIPPTYTCVSGINPVLLPGSCWWGIEYNFSASANDVTTWRARIEGNPVHLTQ